MTDPFMSAPTQEILTMAIGVQKFGVPVAAIRDVLHSQPITKVPLAAPHIAGVMNLRGRIVTVISTRIYVGLPEMSATGMFVVVAQGDQLYALLVDRIGESLVVNNDDIDRLPAHIKSPLRSMATGVARCGRDLVLLLDISEFIGLTRMVSS